MAAHEKKISDLDPIPSVVTGDELTAVVQDGVTYKGTLNEIISALVPSELLFAGDPGQTIVPGDPLLPAIEIPPGGTDYGSTAYELAIASIDSAGTHLTWTFPEKFVDGITVVPGGGTYGTHWPVFGLYLQRSPTSNNMPHDDPYTPSVSTEPLATQTTPDWVTIMSWLDTSCDLLPTSYTDPSTPDPLFSYRLIMQMGVFLIGPGGVAEIDWNVVLQTRTYLLTGASVGGKVNLTWNDPANALYNGFTVERSNTPGTWEMVYGDGGLFAKLGANIRSVVGLDPANQFRVKGYLTVGTDTGIVVAHNDVTLAAEQPLPRAQLERMFGKTVSAGYFQPSKIAIDNAGNTIVVGQMAYSVNTGCGEMTTYFNAAIDAFIAKWNSAGVCLWAKHYGSSSDDEFKGLCVDSSNNIYAIGYVSGGVDPGTLDFGLGTEPTFGGADIYLIKFDSNGVVLWHKLFGGSGTDKGLGVVVDSTGVYITGTMGFFGTGANFGGGALTVSGVAGSVATFLAKLSPLDGSHIWSKSYHSDGGKQFAVDLKLSSDGHVIIGAEFKTHADWGLGVYDPSGGYDGAIVKVNATTGATMWQHKISGTADNRVACISTSTGKIFVVGNFTETISFNGAHSIAGAAGGSFYLLQLNNDGTYANAISYGVEINGPSASGVAASDALGVVVIGVMSTGVDFGQGFLLGNGGSSTMLLRFNPDLTTMWSRRGFSNSSAGDSGIHVVLGSDIYIVGGGTVDGFERNTGFNQTTIDTPVAIVSTAGVTNNSYWVKFSP